MLKKLVLTILASLILLVSMFPLFTKPARAQVWFDQTPQEWFVKVYDPDNPTEIFGERYTAAQVQWVILGLFSFFIPGPLKPVVRCFMTRTVIGDCTSAFANLFAFAPSEQNHYAQKEQPSLLAAVFAERPFSGITYIKDSIRKFQLIPEAKAQQAGFGYQGLSLMQDLWRASRNIAYLFFVIAIVIMAFMIMFRVKISPQVVISVQSSLPKIVIALVLVTFSYAIAGFLVDLMYVVIGIISLLISNSGAFLPGDSVALFNWLTKGTVAIPILPNPDLGLAGMLIIYLILFTFVLFYVLFLGGGILGTIITVPLIPVIGLVSLIVAIVLYLLLIFISLKITWMLIKAFASILLLTVVAPFQIAAGIIIPGVGFGAWVRSFLGNLAVFPLTGLIITFAYILLIVTFRLVYGNAIPAALSWLDVFGIGIDYQVVDGWPPLIGVGNRMVEFMLLGTSLAVLFIAPKAADIIKGMIQGRPFAYGTGIGQAFGPLAWGAVGAEYMAGRKIAGIEAVGGEGRTAGWEAVREIAGQAKRGIQGLGR